ncbi:unnamed protein product [Brachionus calyciflorus]|uniref:Uncharacterized protein n=1 Tax=Brachionus calyciflorus TaxID=104777 RepID=A0A813PRL2_9BILA|nr:unnamed protein product [Brachionus calyciflorus]
MKKLLVLNFLIEYTLSLSYSFIVQKGILSCDQTEILFTQEIFGSKNLFKCLGICMTFSACKHVTLLSNNCSLYTNRAAMLTSSSDKFYTRKSGNFEPVFHWPIYKASVNELVTNANLYNPYNAGFTSNRFGENDSALRLNFGYYYIPGRHYFTNDFTVMTWIKMNSLATNGERFIDCGLSELDTFIISVSYENYNIPYIKMTEASGTVFGFNKFEVNKWYHFTFVLKSSIGFIYFNGIFQSWGIFGSPRNINRTSCFLGKSHLDNPNLNADLDDIKIFNQALDVKEIKEEMSKL